MARSGDRQHSIGQRLTRFLFRFFGPAQNGPPPYATAEEVDEYRQSMQPRAVIPPSAPAGFSFREYTDSEGVVHRYLVEGRDPL